MRSCLRLALVAPSPPPASSPPPPPVGSQPADLTGWKIHDAYTIHTYTFPGGYSLGAGASVSVKSGGAAGPGELHWMNGFVWNNDGDTASLVDPAGATRSTRSC